MEEIIEIWSTKFSTKNFHSYSRLTSPKIKIEGILIKKENKNKKINKYASLFFKRW